MQRKKVIIVGGGFAGNQLIEHLDQDLFDVLLIDKLNHHQFQPLFYQVANVAINQARNLAKNLKSLVKSKPLREYEYRNKGSMATIGKNKAVVDLPFIRFQGYFAWFVWMFLHLMLILSIRNKMIVFFNWAINYFTKDSSLRLILQEKQK